MTQRSTGPAPTIWMRAETGFCERRTPLTPEHAAELIAFGLTIVVEECPQRIFPARDYAAAGCRIADRGSWIAAPAEAWILGLKKPADAPYDLRHRHIFFAHAYKGQPGAITLLDRFRAGGGRLYDLEYVTDDEGRRKLAFGYWAGFAGAALAAVPPYLRTSLLPSTDLGTLEKALSCGDPHRAAEQRALVIGARGRCGRGAADALRRAGIEATHWNREDTRRLNKAALLSHDMVVNCIHLNEPTIPFLVPSDLRDRPEHRLRMLVDVTCDFGTEMNAFPVYSRCGSLAAPFVQAHDEPRLSVLAVANLPSLLPEESSRSFSRDLGGELRQLPWGDPWQRAHAVFVHAIGGRREAASIKEASAPAEMHL